VTFEGDARSLENVARFISALLLRFIHCSIFRSHAPRRASSGPSLPSLCVVRFKTRSLGGQPCAKHAAGRAARSWAEWRPATVQQCLVFIGIARDASAGNATAGRDPRSPACDRGQFAATVRGGRFGSLALP
jgi:hypothetical protein